MFDELQVFLTIVKSKSMAEAGRSLNLSSATVARKLSRLEELLGAKLIERNTRAFSLTHAGLHCYEHCQSIPQIIDEMKNTITESRTALKGILNVNITCYSAFDELLPKFIEFNQAYPGIVLNVTKSNIFPDLVDDSYDVYIRYGEVSTRSLISIPIAEHQMCVCASLEYLKDAPLLDTPHDISSHRCIVHRYNKYEGEEWIFVINGKAQYINIQSPLIFNNAALVLEAVERGGGLAYIPYYLFENNPHIKPLLESYAPEPKTVYLTYPRGKHIYEKTRVFVEFLLQSYQQ